MKATVWTGAKPPPCAVCEVMEYKPNVPAVVDGKTTRGPWALMCERHFESHGVGLGMGRGQRLVQSEPEPEPADLDALADVTADLMIALLANDQPEQGGHDESTD